ILSFTGDNATSNDKQTKFLSNRPENSFKAVNQVRCFNHTLNLAVKSLLRPFQRPAMKDGTKVTYNEDD
ncbi:hypothetical protein C8J56DRAFT_758721, partial [Mycena floridula]